MARKKQQGNGSGTVYPRKDKDGKVTSYLGSYFASEGEPAVFNSHELAEAALSVLGKLGFGSVPEVRSFGADDFGYYCTLLPCLMLFVGTKGASPEANKPLHHPQFLPPDEAVRAVARTLLAGYLAAARRSGVETLADPI